MGRRIVAQTVRPADRVDAHTAPDLNQYWDRLKNLIPTEVSALYIAGQGVIPPEERLGSAAWAVVCLAFVVLYITHQTQTTESQPGQHYPTDWIHVAISAVSFIIWVYALGGPFAALGLYVAWLGALAMLAWTFVVPYVYRGQPA